MKMDEIVYRKDLVLGFKFFTSNHYNIEDNAIHDTLEIILVTKGAVNIKEKNVYKTIHSGEFYIVNSFSQHSLTVDNSCEICQGCKIFINRNFLKETVPEIDSIKFTQPNKEVNDVVYRVLLEMMTHYEQNTEYLSVYLKGMAYIILYIFLDELFKNKSISCDNQSKEKKYTKRVLDIINYIEQHYKENISFEHIAELYKMSTGHFYKFFKEHVGTTPKEYLTNYRLTHVAMDLINKDDTIIDIAFEHGFTNIKSFYTLFKRAYGVLPTEYRKKRNLYM